VNDFEMTEENECPACNGTGAVTVLVRQRQYVSRDMAHDAGFPEMEGSVYTDEDFDYEPCPDCDGTGHINDTKTK
jgi:DnaJ-class molecular chaperone